MTLIRRRDEFWGTGGPHIEAGSFSVHYLSANPPEDEVERHTHEQAHFILVLAGAYKSSAKDAPVISKVPLLVYNPPGTTHRDRFLGGRGSFLAVSGGDLSQEGWARALHDPFAIWTARQMAQDYRRDGRFALRMEGRAFQLIAAAENSGLGEKRRMGKPRWLATAFQMLFEESPGSITIKSVAAAAGVHPVHLARVFRHHLGCSPGEFLRGRRLERAAAVLGAATASLADAAHAAGYVDQPHLTHAFRRGYGVTPRAWRDRNVASIQYAGGNER